MEETAYPATKPILTLDDSADAGLSDACNGIRQAAASMLLRTPLYSCFFDEMFGPGFMPVSPATKRRALLLLDPIVMTDAYLFSRKVFHRLLMRHGEGESHDLSSVRRSFQAMSTLRSGMRDTGPDAPPVVSEWDPSKSNKVAHAIAAAAVHSANTRQKQANRSKKLFARHADALKLQRLRIFSACDIPLFYYIPLVACRIRVTKHMAPGEKKHAGSPRSLRRSLGRSSRPLRALAVTRR